MANLIRKIASELTGFVISRLTAPRKKLRVPASISLELDKEGISKIRCVKGETKDLSVSGIAFILPSIRISEKYLVGEDRTMYVDLDLPNGQIKLELIGCRYEQLGIHDSVATYVIGARITNISDPDRALYEEYLKYGDSLKIVKDTDLVAEVSES